MTNKTALVTGSSSGIGLATARALAKQGIQVMLNGLEENQEGATIAATIEQEFGTKTRYCCADLSNPGQIEQLFESMLAEFGGIDILVNNAGIQYTAATTEFPPEKWDQVIAVNLTAAFHTSRLALPLMKKSGWGRIVNIASVHGLVASANKSAYCAAKHGLIGFTKVVALEHAADGITANSICPGWTDTPLLQHQFKVFAEQHGVTAEEAKAGLVKTKTPYPGLIQPSAIGDLVVFLCTDSACGITGAALPIDGAWTAQ
ncbi:MAG: 3-hydroxybutyrate dehydrogenase [Motiliproteus sp.]